MFGRRMKKTKSSKFVLVFRNRTFIKGEIREIHGSMGSLRLLSQNMDQQSNGPKGMKTSQNLIVVGWDLLNNFSLLGETTFLCKTLPVVNS